MNKICFFSGDITRSGGTEHVCLQIASRLADSPKYLVSIISLMEAAGSTYYEYSPFVRRHTILAKPVAPIRNAIFHFFEIEYWLIHFIKKNQIDVIIDVDGILDVFSLPAKIFTPVKVVTWEHFNYYSSLGNPLRMLLRRISARFADYIVVLTKADQRYCQKNMKLKCPIENIYNPIDIKENTVYDRSSKTILSVGRLNRQKGFDLLVEAARLVLPKHKDWTWVIAGDGEARSLLTKKIKEYGLEAQLQLIGKVKDIERYYAHSAMFVLTSRFEGFVLAMIEAKSYHLPVVSFACRTGPKEAVLHGKNGFLVKCFAVEAMACKINLLIERERLRIEFSEHAADNMEKLSYQRVMKKWEAVLDFLLKENS